MRPTVRRRLSYRQARNAVLIAFLLGLALTVSQVALDVVEGHKDIDRRAAQLLEIVRESASRAAYNIDQSLALNIIEGLFKYEPIRQAQLIDDFGTVLAFKERPMATGWLAWLVDITFGRELRYDESLSLLASDISLGRIEIVIDGYLVCLGILKRTGVMLLSGLALTAILTLVLHAMFSASLTKPLLEIVDRLSYVNPARPERAVIHTPKGHADDELGLLSQTINRLLQELGQSLQRREELQSRLQQTQKMEAIGNLAGGIAHEFNNILTVIIGFTELTRIGLSQEGRTSEHLQEVLKAGGRARELVQQIVTFSRPGAPERKLINAVETVEEVLTLVRVSLPATIDVQAELDPDSGAILANQTQLHQMLLNLVTNAEHAMRETGGQLYIGVAPVEVGAEFAALHPPLRPGMHVKLTVRDSGPGMEPGVVEHIFEPFFTTKDIGEGSGMGLAIVHGLVGARDGAITVNSTPDIGSTFDIYLPRHGERVVTEEAEPLTDLPRGQGRILVVDDDATLVRLIDELLSLMGYAVLSTAKSAEALSRFKAAPEYFDLAILDQNMPEMTGAVLTQELRRIRPDFPVIICTGFSHQMTAERAEELGINAFCMKPLEMHELAEVVQSVLDTTRAKTTAMPFDDAISAT